MTSEHAAQQFAVLAALASDRQTVNLNHGDLTIIAFLGTLGEDVGTTVVMICAATRMSLPTVSRALSRFLDKRLVWRRPEKDDLRQINYGLTARGRALDDKVGALFRNPPTVNEAELQKRATVIRDEMRESARRARARRFDGSQP